MSALVNLEALTRPFPKSAIRQRKGGGGVTLDYLEGHTVIRRLNEATGNNWSLSVLDISERTMGGQTLIMARVALTIPGHGSREALGVQMVNERGGEDLLKGAITDALKKAATLFGVGLELYGPDYEAGEAQQPQRPPQATQRPVQPFQQAGGRGVPYNGPSSPPASVSASAAQLLLIKRLQGGKPAPDGLTMKAASELIERLQQAVQSPAVDMFVDAEEGS